MILLHGENSWASFERYKNLKDGSLQKGYDVLTINADDINDLNYLLMQFDSIDMFGAKKVIFIKRLLSNRKSSLAKELGEFLKKENNLSAEIVFWEDKPVPKNLVFYKVFKDKHKIEEFSVPKKFEIEKWTRELLVKNKVSLSPKDTQLLIELSNYDQNTIINEVNKLSSITDLPSKNIQSIISNSSTIQVWGFVDDFPRIILEGIYDEKDKLYRTYLKLRSQEDNEILIHSLLVRQVRILIRVKLLLNDSKNSSEIASTLRLPPFKMNDYMNQAKKFAINDLVKLFEDLIICEEKMKTGRSENPMLDLIMGV